MAIDQDKLDELALAPKKVVGDEGSVEERDLDDIIKADKYAASNSTRKPPFGMSMSRVWHGSTTD